nr:MAG TPA: Histone-like Protein p6 [Caudoviricetes sp.]
MARKRMVTRTITFTTATATVYDIQSDEIQTLEYKLSGELSADDALKAITKEHAEVRPLKVSEVEVQEELYGMSEEKFLELAEILPSRAKAQSEE